MSNAPAILISANFRDLTNSAFQKARFQFSATGTQQTGVLYATEVLTADRKADIRRAAAKVAKRAGATEVTLHTISA